MKTLFKKALRKQQFSHWALIDATTEQPNKYLGTVISMHLTRSEVLICEMDFQEGTPNSRTRVVKLKQRVAPGTLICPNDLEPIRAKDQTES
jgi:hypothetical protein